MPKQILAAIDISTPSNYALQRAFQLASEQQSGLQVLHALSDNSYQLMHEILGDEAKSLYEQVKANIVADINAVLLPLQDQYALQVPLLLKDGEVTDAVLTQLEQSAADLLVLGAHGRGLLQELMLGSVASAMLRKSPVPVLLAKRQATGPYQSVVVAVDFSTAGLAAAKMAVNVAKQAHWQLVHALDLGNESLLLSVGINDAVLTSYKDNAKQVVYENLHALAADLGLSPESYTAVVVEGAPAPALLQQIDQTRADLLVLGKHGTRVVEELLLGSITKKLVKKSPCDLLLSH